MGSYPGHSGCFPLFHLKPARSSVDDVQKKHDNPEMKQRLPILTWLAAVVILAACQRQVSSPKESNLRVEVSPSGERVTISAPDAPLSSILAELSRHGIQVGLSEPGNPNVTADVKNAPLDEAIAQVLPKGSRYAVRLGDREIAREIPDLKGRVKEGDKAPPRRDLPSKDTPGARPPIKEGLVRKPSPDAPMVTLERGNASKPETNSVIEVPRSEKPKEPRLIAGEKKESVHLRFAISRKDGITLQSAVMIPGEKVESNVVRGTLLVVMRDRTGAIVAADTLTDPLEEHAYLEQGQHGVMQAEEGSFGVTLPNRVASAETIAGITLQFYDIRNLEMPQRMDQQALPKMLERAKELGKVEGESVAVKLRAGTQPKAE